MKLIFFLLLSAQLFSQTFIVLTEGQAELIKNRYGIYSELDPIQIKDGNYILPLDCINDVDLIQVKKWLQKLPTRTITQNDFRADFLLPKFTDVVLGQGASITANIPDSVNLANLTFQWGRRTVKTWVYSYKYDSEGNVIDSVYRPSEWNDWTVLTGRTTQTITSPNVTSAYQYNKIGVRITHTPTGKVYEDYTILRVQ